MSDRDFFLFGDSHYAAIAMAAEARSLPAEKETDSAGSTFHIFNGWKHDLLFPFIVARNGEWMLNPRIQAYIESVGQTEPNDIVLSSIFGGGHGHVLGMISQGKTDIYLEEFPLPPISEDARILTRGFIEDTFMEYLVSSLEIYSVFRRTFPDATMIQLEAPPCIGDDDFVQAHMGPWFEAIAKERGGLHLNPPHVRQKFNWIESQIYRKAAKTENYEFQGSPDECKTSDGFLKPEYYGTDAVHANALYGEFVIQKLEKRLETTVTAVRYFG